MKRNAWLVKLVCVLTALMLVLPAFAEEVTPPSAAESSVVVSEEKTEETSEKTVGQPSEAPSEEAPKTEEKTEEKTGEKTEEKAGEAAEAPAETDTEQPAEAPEEEAAEEPVAPQVLDLSVRPEAAVQGEAVTVRVKTQGIEKLLLLVDGEVYPAPDTAGLKDEEIAALLLQNALSVRDGQTVATVQTDALTVGEHEISVRYLENGEWSKSGKKKTLTVLAAEEKPAEEPVIEEEVPVIDEEEVPVIDETVEVIETPVDEESKEDQPEDGQAEDEDGEAAANATTRIIPDETAITLNVGDTAVIGYTLEGDESEVTFKSSKTTVATVDENGEVTARKSGTALITLRTQNNKTATVKVTVTDENPPSKIVIEQDSPLYIPLGQTDTLTYLLTPDDAQTYVTWTSSKTAVAAVDANGDLTAKKAGTTVIRATTSNGKTASLTVVVYDPDVPYAVSIDREDAGVKKLYVAIGEGMQMSATVLPDTVLDDTVTWKTSNKRYATIDESGYLEGVKAGTVTVTVTTKVGKKTDKITVVVYDPTKPQYVTLDQSGTIDLAIDDTLTLNAAVFPDTADQTVTFISSNKKIASVDESGTVTGIKTGTVTLRARASNGKTASVKVRVYDPRVPQKITLNYTGTETMDLSDAELTVSADIYPGSAQEYTDLIFYSSSTRVATVSSDGVITPRREGKAVITVTTKNAYQKTKVTAKFTLVVKDKYAPSRITFDERLISLDLYDTAQLSYTLAPDDARATVTYSTASNVVEVSEDGEITPLKAGRAIVTATTHNGKKATATIVVTDTYAPSKISFEKSAETVFVDQSPITLSPTLYPDTARAKLTWTSSNKKVATVDEDGIVTLLSEGTATITVKTHNSKSASVKLTVSDPTLPVKLTLINADTGAELPAKFSWDDTVDGSLNLGTMAAAKGGDGYDADTGDIKWTSSAASVASIDQNGIVTYKKNGTVRFTAKTTRGSVSATVTVTFTKYIAVESITISATSLTMLVGGTLQLIPSSLPVGSLPCATLSYSSSDESVVTVSSAGKLTAVGAGYATILCTDEKTGVTSNQLTFSSSYPPTYRALILAHPTEKSVVRSNTGVEYNVTWQRTTDVKTMYNLLNTQNYGGKKFKITTNANATKSAALSAIASIANQSRSSDVTVVAILAEGTDNGSIWLGDEALSAATLAEALDQIEGRVIVFMANDYSGYYITESSDGSGMVSASSNASAQGQSFNSAFIGTFKSRQSTVEVYPLDANGDPILPPEPSVNEDGSVSEANWGELRQDKFYVITAASAYEETYFLANVSRWNTDGTATLNEGGCFDYFVRGLAEAAGFKVTPNKGGAGAASWSGRMVTLQQAYVQTAAYVKKYESASQSTGYNYSNVQVYPQNSSYVIFQH